MSNFFYENQNNIIKKTEYDGKPPLKGRKLNSLLKEGKVFSKDELFIITEQLLNILDKMRAVFPPIVHKNINPANVIIKKDLEIAIIGFGKEVKKETSYTAPEVLNSPTPKVDLYSVGKIIKKASKLKDSNFNKFIRLMIDENPNNRFNNTKIAKKIFMKIKDGTISINDWETNSGRKEKKEMTYDDFLIEKDLPEYGFNRSLRHISVERVLTDAIVKKKQVRDFSVDKFGDQYSENPYITKEEESSSVLYFIVFVAIAVTLFFVKTLIFSTIEDALPCDIPPAGHHYDEDCRLIPGDTKESIRRRENDIKRREENKKDDEELKRRFKKSGLGDKY